DASDADNEHGNAEYQEDPRRAVNSRHHSVSRSWLQIARRGVQSARPKTTQRILWAGSTCCSERKAQRPETIAMANVTSPAGPTMAKGMRTCVPMASASQARASVIGTATIIPASPTQKDCAKTDIINRQRGMPIALSVPYSRCDATVAAYRVWLVTTAPTTRPRQAVNASPKPALVVVIQCNRDRVENSSRVKIATFG